MDDVDKAQEREEEHRDAAFERVRKALRASAQRPEGFCGKCVVCESPLPGARLDAGYCKCVECVQEEEARARQYR